MSRMICRPRLRRGKNGLIVVAAICLGLMVTSARAGDLTPTAGPTSSASAMWTLEHIYNVLDTRTTNVTLRTGGFTEPTAGPTNGTMHTLNDIMALVTNRAPVAKTGATNFYLTGDDRTYQAGVAWPTNRFITNAVPAYSNCVIDKFTGLMWLKNPDSTTRDWTNALTYCEGLNGADGRGGYTDWRVPNANELRSLIDFSQRSMALPPGHPFIGLNTSYWVSTPYNTDTTQGWNVNINNGSFEYAAKTTLKYVWPVRGGQ